MCEQVVRVSWQSEAMPVPAYNYWHKACYVDWQFPNKEVRELSADEVYGAVCCGCWQKIKKEVK